MYLSDRDIKWAIESEKLIVDPPPDVIDATSIDLHLDSIEKAKIWDLPKYIDHEKSSGRDRPELRVAKYHLGNFSKSYLTSPPSYSESDEQLVGQRGAEIVVKRGGFLLWQTKERVGTPDENADLICFVDGKSTRARAGILVHLTAPTIHASWVGNITLEIANLGPFDVVLQEGDVIAQLTVAKITSPPQRGVRFSSATFGQSNVDGTG